MSCGLVAQSGFVYDSFILSTNSYLNIPNTANDTHMYLFLKCPMVLC